MERLSQELREYLEQRGTTDCTIDDIAGDLGVTGSTMNKCLWWLRHPVVVARHGWTIPFQRPGPTPKAWRVVGVTPQHAVNGAQDGAAMRSLLVARIEDEERHVQRTRAWAVVQIQAVGANSPAGQAI